MTRWPAPWRSVAAAVLMVAPAAVLMVALPTPGQGAGVPEPDGYRAPPYAAPVPDTLAGAQLVDGKGALALHAEGVPFIDVYPRTARPEGLAEGTLWRQPVHETIPGATWAPGTGYDRLSPAEEARLSDALATVTGGERTRPVVIFCHRNCWLSWNAARRAVGLGYTAVIWFPDGIEGWQEAGGALVAAR